MLVNGAEFRKLVDGATSSQLVFLLKHELLWLKRANCDAQRVTAWEYLNIIVDQMLKRGEQHERRQ
jgi:hypothetical protein